MCFDDTATCPHECHCTGDVICDSNDGDCGEAGCDSGADFQYYGPPACQRVMKALYGTEFQDKRTFIRNYIVSHDKHKL